MAGIGNVLVKVSADIRGLSENLDKAERRLSRAGRKLSSIGNQLTASISLPIAAAGGAALKAAADYERLETQLSTLTGSAEMGAKIFKELKEFAAKTPFQLSDITKTTNQLLAFGFTVDESLANLQTLGDIAAATGSNMSDLALILGQSKAIGAAYTQDLRQLANRGIPVFDILKDQLQVTGEELDKMVSSGQISFEILQEALASTAREGGLFFGGMEAQSKTLHGLFSTLRDNVTAAFAELGAEIAKTVNLRQLMARLTQKIQDAVKWFEGLSESGKKTTIVIAGITAALGPFLSALGAMRLLIASGVAALSSFGKGLAFFITPTGAIIAAIAGITYAILKLKQALNEVKDKWGEFRDIVLQVSGKLMSLTNPVYGVATELGATSSRDLRRRREEGFTSGGILSDAQFLLGATEDAINEAGPISPDLEFDLSNVDEAAKKAGETAGEQFAFKFNDAFSKTTGEISNQFADDIDIFSGIKQAFIDFVTTVTNKGEELSAKTEEIVQDFKQISDSINTAFSEETLEPALEGLNKFQTKVADLETSTEENTEAQQQMESTMLSMVSAVGSGLQRGAKNFHEYAGNVAIAIGKAIKSMLIHAAVERIAKNFGQWGIPGAIAAGVGIGLLNGIVDQFISKIQAPALATGGLAYGPTLAMVGDNPGANINPEVIAPLDQLQKIMGGGNLSGRVELDAATGSLWFDFIQEHKRRFG